MESESSGCFSTTAPPAVGAGGDELEQDVERFKQ